jgi:transposase-like protein
MFNTNQIALATQAPPVDARGGNALRHGLTSSKILPPALRAAVAANRDRLRQELLPRNFLEEILVSELARHAAYLEFAEQAEASALGVAAAFRPDLCVLGQDDLPITAEDLALTAAVTSDAAARVTVYRRLHERGLSSAMRSFHALRENSRPPQPAVAEQFPDEASCQAYLAARFHSPRWRCPRCDHARGYWLDSRRRWECAGCKMQFGERAGTILERSPLPLATWFVAIGVVSANLEITATELARRISVRRLGTVRSLIKKIRAAMASPDADRLLAGLQRPTLQLSS